MRRHCCIVAAAVVPTNALVSDEGGSAGESQRLVMTSQRFGRITHMTLDGIDERKSLHTGTGYTPIMSSIATTPDELCSFAELQRLSRDLIVSSGIASASLPLD